MPASNDPFRYPKGPHIRRHGPSGYDDVESFRPWLRDEFQFRCVYCLEREVWTKSVAAFDIDHHAAVGGNPGLQFDYDNLLYVCHACNLSKGSQAVPDPLRAMLSSAVIVKKNGELEGKTPPAKKLIACLRLNRVAYKERRQLIRAIVSLASKFDLDLLAKMLGYPANLPDLSQLRPPTNRRPAGIRKSCYARQAAGSLPDTY
jgi:hypothetical protein